MNHQAKVILSSLIFAMIIVALNKTISYYVTGHFPDLISIRSTVLFVMMFVVGMQTIGGYETTTN